MEEKTWFIQYLPQIFIVSGIVLTAIGGVISFGRMIEYRSENIELGEANKELNQKNLEETDKVKDISALNALISIENKGLLSENTVLTKLNQDLINSNIDISKSNMEISNSNKELSNQIISRAEILHSEITGGDTYLEIIIKHDEENNQFLVHAEVDGDFNPKNIYLSITEKRERVYNKEMVELNKGVLHQLEVLPIPKDRDYLLYEIVIYTKNGSYNQYAFLRKQGSKFYSKMIYFNSLKSRYFLRAKFYPQFQNCPEGIWNIYPTEKDLGLKYDRNNKETLEAVKNQLKQGYIPIEAIQKLTGVPIQKIIDLKAKIEKEASK